MVLPTDHNEERIVDWQTNNLNIRDMFACGACGDLFPTRLEADLCTPAARIEERYGVSA